VVAAYCVVEGVATIPRPRGLRVCRIRRTQAGIRVLAPISGKVFSKEIRQPLVETSARLGSRAADSGGARNGRPPVILEREAHAVFSTAGTRACKPGRQLREVLTRIVVKSAPGAIRSSRCAVARGGPWCDLRVCARSRRRVPRYRRHSCTRCLQHSQLFPMVAEARLWSVPVGGSSLSVGRGVFWGERWRDGAR
jgi:hypothetical protein